MATLTNIIGFLYTPQGAIITEGILHVTLQQDMISVDSTKVAPFTVSVDLSTTGGEVDIDVYATEGATPAGLAYKAEFDPDPLDISKPIKNKDGYWRNYWAVPNAGSVALGSFVTALRGIPAFNYMPLGGTYSGASDSLTLGTTSSGNKQLIAFGEGIIRYNTTTNKWQFADDGVTFGDMLQGGGGAVGGDLSGTVGSATVIKLRGKAISSTLPTTTGQVLRWNQSLTQWEPSLDASQFTGISASSLTTGTLPLARLVDITNAQISATAAIAWSKLSMTGSSLANLATRSAADLNSGIIPLARISGLTNTEVSASAAIDATKIANGTISNTEFQFLNGLDQTPSTTSASQLARLGLGGAADSTAALKITGQYFSPEVPDGNSGAAITIDWALGNDHSVTWTAANPTVTFSNPKSCGRYVLMAFQDGTGGRAPTWPGNVVWSGGIAPTPTALAGKMDLYVFIYNLTTNKYYGAVNQNY